MGKTNSASIEINSKMKKKFKLTMKKMQISKEKLSSVISYLQNPEKEKYNQYSPIYLYIILKDPINSDENLKKIKNKLIKLKHAIISPETNQKQCLIEDDLNEKEKIELNEGAKNLVFLTNNQIKEKIKKLKENDLQIESLNYIYQLFISNSKYNFSQLDNLNKKCDVLYYQKKNIDKLKEIIQKVNSGATIIKINNNKKVFRIKCGNVNMNKKEIINNIFNMIYKGSSFILANSQKHNNIQTIVVKSEESIPFMLYGELSVDNLSIFDK